MELRPTLPIAPGMLVLDVGSGDFPHPAASVLVDRFLDYAGERHNAPLTRDRPLVVADVERLPFRGKAFGYAIASHVLEHTSDPVRAAAELSRVAERGYVETPSEVWEFLYGQDFHRFAVSLDGDQLVFRPKLQASPLSPIFRRLAEKEPLLVDLGDNHPELMLISVQWEGSIRCKISDEPWPLSLAADSFINRLRAGRTTRRQALRSLARAMLPPNALERLRLSRNRFPLKLFSRANVTSQWKRNPRWTQVRVDLHSLLICPACHSERLSWAGSEIRCVRCGRTYEHRDGIPVMLVDD
jgi:uncharacterized protein YbaR (Trm112 family)